MKDKALGCGCLIVLLIVAINLIDYVVERIGGTPTAILATLFIGAPAVWFFISDASVRRETEAKLKRDEEARIAKEEEDRRKKQEKERSEREIAAEKAARQAAEISQQAADYSLALELDDLSASEIYARLATEAHREEIRLIARLESQGFVAKFIKQAYSVFIRGDDYEDKNQDAFDIELERLVRKLKYREKKIEYHQKELRSHLGERFRKFVQLQPNRKLQSVEFLKGMRDVEFENWVIEQLRSQGYRASGTRRTGDHGVDVVAEIGKARVGIQAKGRASTIGKDAVYEVNTGRVMYDAAFAWVVTNSTFTKQAKEVAAQVDVTLVDRAVLMQFDQFLQEWARDHAGSGPQASD